MWDRPVLGAAADKRVDFPERGGPQTSVYLIACAVPAGRHSAGGLSGHDLSLAFLWERLYATRQGSLYLGRTSLAIGLSTSETKRKKAYSRATLCTETAGPVGLGAYRNILRFRLLARLPEEVGGEDRGEEGGYS